MSQTINITKVKTTRGGLPVRIYATDSGGAYPIHGAIFEGGQWRQNGWTQSGSHVDDECEKDERDLVEEKTWRAWRKGECPKFFMARTTGTLPVHPFDTDHFNEVDLEHVFQKYRWLHEDGSMSICGVEE